MPYGLPWSEQFIEQLSDRELRDEYVADRVRSRFALLIRALREQRGWSQAELGRQMGKPQSVVSRLEDPEYGKLSLQSMLEVAQAFDLPIWIDLPEWDEWFRLIGDVEASRLRRRSFDSHLLKEQARAAKDGVETISRGNVIKLSQERTKAGPTAAKESRKTTYQIAVP